MPPVGFEPTISVDELPQTHALDRAATGTGVVKVPPTITHLASKFTGVRWADKST